MGLEDILSLFGGLALFLYGMQMMSRGLEDAAGNKMKAILEKLTANRFLGVAVGAGITAVIQSSSATTVMVVGFVNTGMMTLIQAVWIIMGANIGTTVTGLLISLDVGMLAPLVAFIGVALITFFKNPKCHHIGMILAGFGVLFIGMDMMSTSMYPLRESEAFISLMTKFSNPVLGILAGALFTAVIQSSSASIGILQALAMSGLIDLPSAIFVLFGQNIGTCITAVLASIGTTRNAKRTTLIHLMFNLIGTAVFTTLALIFPVAELVASFTPDNVSMQIANMHVIFNITTTILLVPFGTQLAKLAMKILPDKAEPAKQGELFDFSEDVSGNRMLGYSAIHLDRLRQELARMLALAGENVTLGFDAVLTGDAAILKKAEESEAVVDDLNRQISQYISKVLTHSKGSGDVAAFEEYFLISGNAERISDHALNIAGYVETINRKKIIFSDAAKAEIEEMRGIVAEGIRQILERDDRTTRWLDDIAQIEDKMDDLTETYRERHLERMRQGLCTEEGCILYSELLTDFERIGDHLLNVAQAYTKASLRA